MSASQHAQIAAHLRARIESGEIPPEAAIPSEAELTARFGVSRGTVRQALATLRAEGLIRGGRGRRAVVATPALSQSFDEMVSFTAWADALGRVPGARTLDLAHRPCPPGLAGLLAVPTGAPVFHYRRVRLLDGEPVMVEESTFIESVGRLLPDLDLDGGSVYGQLAARGVRLAEADQQISATAAGSEIAGLLGVSRRAPLLSVRRRVRDGAGTPVEVSTDRYRADRFNLTVHHRVTLPRSGVSLTVRDGSDDRPRGCAAGE
ncbi:GntR family transcriptional regulator [Conexibacter sp. DBS9H8]|uniref:GntR family transcriptional regulator n=1 Tax=Conexibacter sp. DBS9H8 TaxID=2937801 RepID=UPI00200EC4D9|nr:GntR family transcriptional regulator [Conexibacter sp. DBS9H8]